MSEQTNAPEVAVQIGERVRILGVPKEDAWLINEGTVKVGQLGVVTDIDAEDPTILVALDGAESWWFHAENLERAEAEQAISDVGEYVPTLGDYAEIIAKLADALGGPATGRDALPPEMHKAYYDAVDRAGLRRIAGFMERRAGRGGD